MELSLKNLNLIKDESLEWNLWYLLLLGHIFLGCILSYVKDSNQSEYDDAAATDKSKLPITDISQTALANSITMNANQKRTQSDPTIEITSL